MARRPLPREESSPAAAPTARFVWSEPSGEGRQQVRWFRRELELPESPQQAWLHLFASSRYLVRVNGAVVASGPARSYPERPEFDSVDLTPHLSAGRSTLSVQVLSFGTSSLQLRRAPGALIAWGTVLAGAQVDDLSTPGAWSSRVDGEYDQTAPRLSFAMSPMEIQDARRPSPSWSPAVPLADQAFWGPLKPRSIPALESRLVSPSSLRAAFALSDSEAGVSFRVAVPDSSRAEYEASRLLFARTRIFSPRAQRVPFGLWWGQYYVNGLGPLTAEPASTRRNRQLVWVSLHEGWNDFFVRHQSVFGPWDFTLSYPRDSGLVLAARADRSAGIAFESAGPFPPEQESELAQLTGPPPEHIAASLDWRGVEASERSLNPAVEVAWRSTDTRLALDPAQVRNIAVSARQDTALVFDFGGTELGRLRVKYSAPRGTTLDLAWAEELAGSVPAVLQQHGLFTGARHVSAGGFGQFETIKPYGMRYLQLNVTGHSEAVTVEDVALVSEVYPLEVRGQFESSDPALNALWQMGVRTLRVCAEDSYIDTPFRERGLYAGDLLVEVAVTLAVSGDLRLAQRSLRLLQGMYRDLFTPSGVRHPDELALLEDFPLLSLETYAWVVRASGDVAFARELFPAYERLLDGVLARRGPDGRVVNDTVFIEWPLPEAERHGTSSTAYHALLARSAASLADLARLLGAAPVAARYEHAAAEVARLMQGRFWDAEQSAFFDGVRGGVPSTSHLPISSAWPSFWGLTSGEQERALGAHWRGLFGPGAPTAPDVSPYGGFFLLGALYRHGHVGLAEQYMRRYWGPMLADSEGTLWEHFERSQGSSSHAWSAAPTYYLSTHALGVRLGYPESDELDSVLIAPESDSLAWAKGTVPHPRGVVGVDWRIEGDVLRASVSVPPGVRYRVEPRGRLARLRLELSGEASPTEPF